MVHRSILFFTPSIKESNGLQAGTMNNSVEDLVVLQRLGVASLPRKALWILSVN